LSAVLRQHLLSGSRKPCAPKGGGSLECSSHRRMENHQRSVEGVLNVRTILVVHLLSPTVRLKAGQVVIKKTS
jgi:hypothetical protein